MKTDHWNRKTLDFLKPHLMLGKKHVRIATGFFTVEGYHLLRDVLDGKRVRLMVGYDEQSRERLREKLIDDVMRHLSTWNGANRREAVVALVAALRNRRLLVSEQRHMHAVDARIRKGDHAKLYIVDQACAIVGSSNLTVSGLRNNVEGMNLIMEPPRVAYWISQFEQYWNDPRTVDLTQLLLERLLAWLELHSPFDVYLKTVHALIGDDETPAPRESYKMPVQFQRVVIERLLRQIKDWGGAFLVASTGLGKTIMATDVAYRLRYANQVFNVIVFAPKQVHPNWRESLLSAGVANEIFTRNLLDQPVRSRSGKVQAAVAALKRADDKTIIFVDESHYFKNMKRALDGEDRHSFDRLFQAVSKRGAKIVLLTATPFAKGIDDLNNQLYLLPHKAPTDYRLSSGQVAMAGLIDEDVRPNAWKVRESESTFFDDFIDLPISTVISTSRVARDFAEHTPEGDYVQFKDQRRWIPRVLFRKLKFPVLEESTMTEAIEGDYFRHKVKKFQNRGVWQRSEVTIQAQAETAWLSSPVALVEVIEKTLDGTYKEKWKREEQAQWDLLEPLQTRLRGMRWNQDIKFVSLTALLRQAREDGRKVLVFTERHATAVYLEQSLQQAMPAVRVACTSERVNGKYDQKNFEKVAYPLVVNFAPEANADYWRDVDDDPESYDVLITTDAYGAGVNLQDASVVINYDLAWTPDTIIQRVGRVLRLWKAPREVQVYVFVGRFDENLKGRHDTNKVEARLRTLTQRGRQAERFSELPFFSEDEVAYQSLAGLAEVVIEELGSAETSEIEEFTGVSGYLRHIAVLKENALYAEAIPEDISSAMVYPEDAELLYLLLRYEDTYHWMFYDVVRQTIRYPKEDRVLNLIACVRDEPTAAVDAAVIEMYAQQCRALWVEQQSADIDGQAVERICALYLQPRRLATGVQGMLF